MATILEFRHAGRPKFRRNSSTENADSGTSAEIVIFPGVRIERQTDSLRTTKAISATVKHSNFNID